MNELPDDNQDPEVLETRLAAAEREIAELQAEKKQLEHRVINANRTLAYGIGRAMIEARSWKGLLALPRKIRRLRLKQRAKKRERVPDSLPTGIAARLRLVDPALERLSTDGAESASAWVRAQSAPGEAKARAIAEIAHRITPEQPELARALAEEATIAGGAAANRLIGLVTLLQEQGAAALLPDPDAIALARAEFGLGTDGPVIFCLGTMAEDEGFVRLLDAFAALVRGGGAARLAFIGGGDAGPWLADQAEARDLGDRIAILGEPLSLRWPALLAAADLLVFPRARPEPEGSDIPALAAIAAALGARRLFGHGWTDAALPAPARLSTAGDWADEMQAALDSPPDEAARPPEITALIEKLARTRDSG